MKDGSLCLRFANIFPRYKEYGDRQGIHTLDKQTLLQYLKQQGYFQPNSDKGRDQKKVRFEDGPYSAYCFDYDQVKINFEKEEI